MLNASGDSAAEAPPLRILKTRAPHAMNVRRFSGLFLMLPFLVKTIQPRPVTSRIQSASDSLVLASGK
jgi:hypothetical protein